MGLLNRIKCCGEPPSARLILPAMDIVLPGERYLHLVGSIHMGTRDMAPPAKLLKKYAGRCVNRRGRYQRQ